MLETLMQNLNHKAKRVTFVARSNVLLPEIYCYHCVPKFLWGIAAQSIIPCVCSTCNELIKSKWEYNITDIKKQP